MCSISHSVCFLGLTCCFISAVIFADLLVGSSHRKSDRKDLDGTYEVDHLAVLGTSSPVSFEKLICLVIKVCFICVNLHVFILFNLAVFNCDKMYYKLK